MLQLLWVAPLAALVASKSRRSVAIAANNLRMALAFTALWRSAPVLFVHLYALTQVQAKCQQEGRVGSHVSPFLSHIHTHTHMRVVFTDCNYL